VGCARSVLRFHLRHFRPVLLGFGNISRHILLPDLHDLAVVVQIQLVVDDRKGVGLSADLVSLRRAVGTEAAELRRVLVRVLGEKPLVVSGGELKFGPLIDVTVRRQSRLGLPSVK